MTWDWDYALDILPDLLSAFVRFTLVATVLGTLLGAMLGLVFAVVRRLRVPVLAPLVGAFIEFVRSTPLLVQLFFLFYVLPLAGVTLPALTTGVIGLGVHYACYYAEIYRAGIDGVPRGQWEASTALSLPRRFVWQHVVLPQAIRRVLPALGNNVISMFKETPFLALITVPEMLQQARSIGGYSFRYVEPITLVGLIFLAASYPTAIALRRLEIRLGR
ncbi:MULTISPECIES: ectoine/hydroxyectoine ABC transporter permease subunit EhuD [Micromonospora]|uniref:Polar amino acid transport system permease protein n=1 Tax=Micromonospora yangpuensis TaxID=683228 RepID=A0A1C6V846_9ACTN|nr:ectoine/hydroxyectoine ABC transporter permease subunit EhuD [Micromonospora yangpuensis]GGM28855.1 ectoine/hydroxyectoine ABC transporter permease subunit EhuD [Micromonospora yangpuensis]SCL62327.1 polar amino acid transport system permease protein [Micromonospora yangpuensis]